MKKKRKRDVWENQISPRCYTTRYKIVLENIYYRGRLGKNQTGNKFQRSYEIVENNLEKLIMGYLYIFIIQVYSNGQRYNFKYI